jgi:hypothetical protein
VTCVDGMCVACVDGICNGNTCFCNDGYAWVPCD